MPSCRICKTRIDVSKTGVLVYRCRLCGRTFCRDHYVESRQICHRCAGLPEASPPVRRGVLQSRTRKD